MVFKSFHEMIAREIGRFQVTLEKLAVRKLKMSAKTAMSVAEKLYTQGYISYPRYFS